MLRIARRLFLIAIVLAGCAPTDSPQPISSTPPAVGEAPRAIQRGAAKIDGSEAGTAAQRPE